MADGSSSNNVTHTHTLARKKEEEERIHRDASPTRARVHTHSLTYSLSLSHSPSSRVFGHMFTCVRERMQACNYTAGTYHTRTAASALASAHTYVYPHVRTTVCPSLQPFPHTLYRARPKRGCLRTVNEGSSLAYLLTRSHLFTHSLARSLALTARHRGDSDEQGNTR